MKSIKTALIAILGAGLVFTGCAKMPEKLVSPTLKIEPVVKDNKEFYKLSLSTGIQNENSDTAFVDLKGLIVFKDGKTRVLTVPFHLPIVLPFDTGIIEAEKTFTESEIMPLVTLLGSDREKLLNEKALERSFIDEKNIGFELTGCEKKNILDVLKDKVNEKIDDSKIYLITAVTTLAVAVILAVVAYYSILSVEPKVEQLLSAKDNISTNYKKAYLILRDPQVFAGYSYFDAEGVSVKNSLAFFDKRVYNGEEIDTNRKAYLELLLERRKKGSVLTRNTMVFFLVLSLAFWAVFVQERRSSRR